jgi:group I intron endonuclease
MKFIDMQLYENDNGVYFIRNNINGKMYIGSTFLTKGGGFKKRYTQYASYKHTYYNKKLLNAFNKYGKENFIFQVICSIDTNIKDCRYLEEWYIKIYDTVKNGYNIKVQGVGGNGGANLGKKYPKPSIETITKRGAGVSRVMKGKKKSIMHCKAMSIAKSGIRSKANRPVYLTNINTGEILYFYSRVAAANTLNCSSGAISDAMHKDMRILQLKYKKSTPEEIVSFRRLNSLNLKKS